MIVFYLTGIIITFFLSVVLAGKKRKTLPDKILMIWLLLLSYHLWRFYLSSSQQFSGTPWLLGTEIPLPLTYGPFLYLYTVKLTTKNARLKQGDFLHFVPAIAACLLLFPFYSLPVAAKMQVYGQEGKGFEMQNRLILVAIIVSGFTYTIACLLQLRRYVNTLQHQFSNTEKINLNWLRYLIWGIAVIWAVVFLGNDTHIFTAVVLYIWLLGFFGIRQVGIFNNPQIKDTENETPNQAVSIIPDPVAAEPISIPVETVKYQKSKIDPDTLQKIHDKLHALMEKEQLYSNPELTLNELSERIAVHPNVLSQVINSVLGKNFYDYINSLRIAAFEKLLADPDNRKYTMLSLAYECGFNSKASFNRNFKKHKGITPTEYLKQNNMADPGNE